MPPISSSGKKVVIKDKEDMSPSVRQAAHSHQGRAVHAALAPVKEIPPTLRLAHVPGAQGDNNLLGQRGVEKIPETHYPALLVSYYYLDGFLKAQKDYGYRNWMMDSGAFSAYNSKKTIDIHKYMETCHRLRECDPTLHEIIALDVIGSGEGSLNNAWIMKNDGIEAMPVFHIGDDWQILIEYAKNWDKVGLSCRFGEPTKESYRFYDQCFARIWPKKTHSFGWVDEKMLMKYPFHSSDSSTWEVGACGFGRYQYFGRLAIKGASQNLRTQIEWYLALEERLRYRWRREMALLDSIPDTGPVLRRAVDANAAGGKRAATALGKTPEVRLVHGGDATADSLRGEARKRSLGRPNDG